MSRTFHNLSAGSTTFMPDGKKIQFGGKVERVEGGTKVGLGTYTTDNPQEIQWLEGLCKAQIPQIWEEVEGTDVSSVPKNVAAGVPADKAQAASEIVRRAEVSVTPIGKAVDAAAATKA